MPAPIVVRPASTVDASAACACVRRSITQLCVEDHRHDGATLERWLANKTPENFVARIAATARLALVALCAAADDSTARGADGPSAVCGFGLITLPDVEDERSARVALL